MRRRFRPTAERLDDRCLPAVSVLGPTPNAEGATEFKLLADGFHFGTVKRTAEGGAAFNAHPDLYDVNGFGPTFYFGPYLGPGGGFAGGQSLGALPVVTANNPGDSFTVQLSGPINRGPGADFGTWAETLTVTFSRATQSVHATGTLSVALNGTLASAGGDLNLGRITGNHLVGVPRQAGPAADTGDTARVEVRYAGGPDPRNFTWAFDPNPHFPGETSPFLSLGAVGATNTVDTRGLGEGFQIAVARKPTVTVAYTASNPADALSAGLSFAADKRQDFTADNVEAVHQVRQGTTTSTNMTFGIDLVATPPPSPPPLPRGSVVASGREAGAAGVFAPGPGGRYADEPHAVVNPFGFGNGSPNVRTATADVDGDTVPDVVLVTGPGTPIRVTVVSGADSATQLVAPFDPFGGNFTGGGYAAAGDLDGDGRAEFVVTPDEGGGPRVTVFGLTAGGGTTVRANFFGIDDANFRGGARAAVGDVNGDRAADLIVAAGFGGGPRVAVFGGPGVVAGAPARLVNDFFAFPGTDALTLRNGVFVAAGDVDGDGFAELIFGGGPGGAPRVFILSGALVSAGNAAGAQASPVANFFVAGNATDRGGVRLAAKDADGDTRADVVAASGEGSPARVRVYLGANVGGNGEPLALQDLFPFGTGVLAAGVFVG